MSTANENSDDFMQAVGEVCRSVREISKVVEVVMWVAVLVLAYHLLTDRLGWVLERHIADVLWKLSTLLGMGSVCSLIWHNDKQLQEEIMLLQKPAKSSKPAISDVARRQLSSLLRAKSATTELSCRSPASRRSSISSQDGGSLAANWSSKLSTTNWVSFTYPEPGVEAFIDPECGDIPAVLIKLSIDVPRSVFTDFIVSGTPEVLLVKKGMDPMILEMRLVESTPTTSVGYSRIWLPFPLSQRDLLYESRVVQTGNETFVFIDSVERSSTPHLPSVVRAAVKTVYKVSSPTANSCFVEFYTRFDPKGSIPKSVLHLGRTKTAGFLCKTKAYLENNQPLEPEASPSNDDEVEFSA
eukprot:TRINITY_DN5388_c0_g1_i1.p1 TRINITY_DN5388_c0_g1~~TRINITY_DN5388_c0_g1_i1.p1  ORF type:complete len:373 (+),score=68.34 TRINITY_DN5388_c0_g1_i1:57-1121(+)